MFGEWSKLPIPVRKPSHSVSKIKVSEESSNFKKRANQFFQQITQIFAKQGKEEKDAALSGRIHELEATGEEVLTALLNIKKLIAEEYEQDLILAVCSLIDPIIREIRKSLNVKNIKSDPAQQVKAYNRYTHYLEKGKLWIVKLSNRIASDQMQDFVKHQTLQEFHARIDRDLQLIQDYLDQALYQLEIKHVNKDSLLKKIRGSLEIVLQNLQSLKHSPLAAGLDSFLKWRLEVDQMRETWFSEALQIIDVKINKHLA